MNNNKFMWLKLQNPEILPLNEGIVRDVFYRNLSYGGGKYYLQMNYFVLFKKYLAFYETKHY